MLRCLVWFECSPTLAGDRKAGLVAGSRFRKVLRALFSSRAREEEREEHLLPRLLHQHMPALCIVAPFTQAGAGPALRLP